MAEHPSVPYTSARVTPEIVNRKDILDQIHAAIADPSGVTYVFYLTGLGGWGKTRLVEEVLCRLQKVRPDRPPEPLCSGEWYSPDILAASRPVDLYHMSTHSEEGLAYEIYKALAPGPDCFADYLKQRQKFEEVKYDLSEILREVNQQQERMIQAFVADFNRLCPTYRRTVLALDTAETLVYETDRVQELLGLVDEPMGVASWLLREFLPQVKNAVILLAGRPETPHLAQDLAKVPNIRFIQYELRPFTEAESRQYIQAMAEAARKSDDVEIAQRIESIPDETRKVLHLYSGGQPLLLSLMLDYLAVTDELIPEVNVSLAEARKRTGLPEGQRQAQNEIRAAIVQRILEIRRPADDVIRMLALTPKGMEPELLARLLSLEPSVTFSQVEAAKARLEELKQPRLSFIKIRPEDARVFLHDEMYEVLGTTVLDSLSPGHREKVENIIKAYCADKVKEARERAQKVSTGEMRSDLLTRTGPLVPGRPEVSPEELFIVRVELQARQVDEVFYVLRCNVSDGFEVYYEHAEEAFQNNDDSLYWQLRDQILRFKDKLVKQPSISKGTGALRPTDIERDVGLRWIKRNVAQGKFDVALKQITLFRSKCDDLIREGGPIAKAELDVWELMASSLAGRNLDRAIELGSGAIRQLESITGIQSRLRRRHALLANAYLYLAYCHRVQGHFGDAIREYKKALPIWRELKTPAEHANTLNNLAWAEAEIGDFDTAIEHCEDALRIRRWMGRLYTVALSLNTLGLIQMRNGQPERAYNYCIQAWEIFRNLGLPRGVGLASIAVTETLRRMTSLPYLFTPDKAMVRLHDAEQYAREAVRIFSEEVSEPMRLVEALIELGCTYREMIRLGRKHELIDDRTCDGLVRAGDHALRRAAKEAEGRFAYRHVDALVNLAWLRYYMGDFVGVEKILHGSESEVLPLIPTEYLIIQGKGVQQVSDPVGWFWVQLGKANLLLGQIAFENYRQLNHTLRDKGVRPEERQDAWGPLKEAGRLWTLSLAYNARYGESFRDLKAGERRLYENLDGLNVQEMDVIRKSIADTIKEYKLPDNLCLMQHFVDRRFGSSATGQASTA